MKAGLAGSYKIAVFGGAALIAFATAFGGVSAVGAGHRAATPASSRVTPAPAVPGASSGPAASGVHVATLTACVSGLDC
jgi:hypothetical protein